MALAQGGVSSSGIRLAPGTPESPERMALIDAFKRQSEGIDKKFEARTHKSGTPLCSFHGDADRTVPVSVSRNRVAARRTAGGRPLYTEYPGVDHNAWEWAYTEPELLTWIFAQRRAH